MSTPFTSPYSDTASLQDLLDEIVLAYSERRQAIGQSVYLPADNRDVQAVAYWTALQNWIETNCAAFVDHINGPASADGSYLRAFTLAAFRTAAGLNPNGFRRATEWDGVTAPEYSYGLMQDGDIIGPWLLEDLQKALTALWWSMAACLLATSRKQGIGNDSDKAIAIEKSKTAFNADDWSLDATPAGVVYHALYSVHGTYLVDILRQKSSIAATGIFAGVPSSILFYGIARQTNAGWGDLTFYDADGLGLVDDQPYLISEQAESVEPTRTAAIGDYATNPANILPESSGCILRLLVNPHTDQYSALLKWNFTNSGTEE